MDIAAIITAVAGFVLGLGSLIIAWRTSRTSAKKDEAFARKSEVEELSTIIVTQGQHIDRQGKRMSGLENENQELRGRVEELEGENADLRGRIDELERENKSLREWIQGLGFDPNTRQRRKKKLL